MCGARWTPEAAAELAGEEAEQRALLRFLSPEEPYPTFLPFAVHSDSYTDIEMPSSSPSPSLKPRIQDSPNGLKSSDDFRLELCRAVERALPTMTEQGVSNCLLGMAKVRI